MILVYIYVYMCACVCRWRLNDFRESTIVVPPFSARKAHTQNAILKGQEAFEASHVVYSRK